MKESFLGALLAFCMIVNLLSGQVVFADDMVEERLHEDVQLEDMEEVLASKQPKVNASAAIVMDMDTGRVLYEKNAHARKAIASTTKIMTGIIAIEKGNLKDVVKISRRAASIGGSTINLKEGQEFTLEELLYGLLMRSGNDAALAIAEHIGGTVENFVEMMNEKARNLGAYNTSFKNPHGLDAPGHYSTAYDLALITRYALKNKTFSRLVATENAYVHNMNFHNTNEMLGLYPGADGVKTGYTGQAGRCLVTSATRNGWRIISVVLGSPSRSARALSSKTILDYAFENYKKRTLVEAYEKVAEVKLEKGKKDTVKVIASESAVLPLRDDEMEAVEKQIDIPEILPAPVAAGIEIGSVTYTLNGQTIATVGLRTAEYVGRKDFFYYLEIIFRCWLEQVRAG